MAAVHFRPHDLPDLCLVTAESVFSHGKLHNIHVLEMKTFRSTPSSDGIKRPAVVSPASVRIQQPNMSILYDRVVNVVSKPPKERLQADLEQILPWFRKKSDLFKTLHADVVLDITKNCKYQVCKQDTVLIRQGEKGDCFYIILSGNVAIHINTTMTEDEFESIREVQEAEERAFAESEDEDRRLDRTKYGIYVGKIDAGKSFGELALINADCVRNATIIAEGNTELFSVDRDLYNRSLRAFQANEFEERKEFVNSFPLFHNWQTRYKKMAAYSLRKVTKNFQDTIVKQGAPIDGIHFIIGGQVRIRVDPSQHPSQYPQLFPLGDIAELEKEKARELLRKEMNLERNQRLDKRSTYQRRAVPTTALKKENLKPLELCQARAIDTIGDIEMAMGLPTYSQTMECTEESTFYHLDQRNYDRLIEKRNPAAIDMIRDIVHTKLTLHFNRLQDDSIPLFRFFLYTLDEKERDARRVVKSARSKGLQEVEANVENLQRGPLVNMYGPGSVFWLIRKRAKQMKVRKQIKTGPLSPAMRFGSNQRQTTFGFTAAASKGVLANPGNFYALGSQGQTSDPSTESFVNLYGYQQGPSHMLDDDGDYIDGDTRHHDYYSGDEDDEYDDDDENDEDRDEDDGKDYATSDSALCQLEERMVQWHNSLGTNQKGTCVVRLHRYQFEDENRPKPGNKVYVKLRSKPKNISFFALQNVEVDDDDSGDEFVKETTTAARQKSINTNIPLVDIVSDRPSDVMSEFQEPVNQEAADESERPQTSLGLQRLRAESKGSAVIVKKQNIMIPTLTPTNFIDPQKKRKQYTVAEYQALKAELRRRQKQWVSLMPQRSTTFF